MGVVLKMFAREILSSDCSSSQASYAFQALSTAIQYFEYLLEIKPTLIDTSQCETEISSCKDILVQTKSFNLHASSHACDGASRISQMMLKHQENKQRQVLEEQQRLAKMEKQQRIINEEKRRRYLAHAQKVLELVKAPAEKPKRGRTQTDLAASAVDFLLPDSAPGRPIKKLHKPKQIQLVDGNAKKSRKSRARKSAKQRAKVLSKAFISSSESDSSDTEHRHKRSKLNILYSSTPVNDFKPEETTFETEDDSDISSCSRSPSPHALSDSKPPIKLTAPVHKPFTPIDFTNRRPSKFRPISKVYNRWSSTTIKTELETNDEH